LETDPRRTLRDLVLFGAGELARLARVYFEADSSYRVVAFTADDVGDEGTREFEGLPCVDFDRLGDRYPPAAADVFVAIGYRRVNQGRAEAYRRALEAGYTLATYISPHAIVSPAATIGRNCFLFEGVIVQPFVTIGDDTIIWSGATVAHDTQVGSHCFLAPMASVSGNVTIGDFAFIGNNATVRDGVSLGPSTVVGAGAIAKWDTDAGAILRSSGTQPIEGRLSSELDRL
jgi:sugar O-acyltransferase (sialic acid O-acetyltransferase NeuD family)